MKYCMQCRLCSHCFPVIYNKHELQHVIYGHLVDYHLSEVDIKEAHKYPWKYVDRKSL